VLEESCETKSASQFDVHVYPHLTPVHPKQSHISSRITIGTKGMCDQSLRSLPQSLRTGRHRTHNRSAVFRSPLRMTVFVLMEPHISSLRRTGISIENAFFACVGFFALFVMKKRRGWSRSRGFVCRFFLPRD